MISILNGLWWFLKWPLDKFYDKYVFKVYWDEARRVLCHYRGPGGLERNWQCSNWLRELPMRKYKCGNYSSCVSGEGSWSTGMRWFVSRSWLCWGWRVLLGLIINFIDCQVEIFGIYLKEEETCGRVLWRVGSVTDKFWIMRIKLFIRGWKPGVGGRKEADEVEPMRWRESSTELDCGGGLASCKEGLRGRTAEFPHWTWGGREWIIEDLSDFIDWRS